jgi:hypothetical protein
MSTIQIDPNSPDVSIRLLVDGKRLRVAKIGPSRMVLCDLADAPATSAQLVIVVNGRRRSRKVMLPHGLDSRSKVVSYF